MRVRQAGERGCRANITTLYASARPRAVRALHTRCTESRPSAATATRPPATSIALLMPEAVPLLSFGEESKQWSWPKDADLSGRIARRCEGNDLLFLHRDVKAEKLDIELAALLRAIGFDVRYGSSNGHDAPSVAEIALHSSQRQRRSRSTLQSCSRNIFRLPRSRPRQVSRALTASGLPNISPARRTWAQPERLFTGMHDRRTPPLTNSAATRVTADCSGTATIVVRKPPRSITIRSTAGLSPAPRICMPS